jgi:hypothetical protein
MAPANRVDEPLVWRCVTRDEWEAFLKQFPERRSYKTGICEPPQEICEWPMGRPIARVTFGEWPEGRKNPDWNAKVYQISSARPPF